MSFSQSKIVEVNVLMDGAELYIFWISTTPLQTPFQVYVDQRLAWAGTAKSCRVPIPYGALGRNTWIEVGAVEFDDPLHDYSSSLSALGATGCRAKLSWLGGNYLDPSGGDDLQGFRIFRSAGVGRPIDLSTIFDTVPAYPGSWISDGWGQGGFGDGGLGRAASYYEWSSQPLQPGIWQFAIFPYDKAGNTQGLGQPVQVTIESAPRPPAIGSNGKRLSYTYSGPVSRQVTLNWLASPSYGK